MTTPGIGANHAQAATAPGQEMTTTRCSHDTIVTRGGVKFLTKFAHCEGQ